MTAAAFESWAILELMGHRVRIGLVSEAEMFGVKMARIEIPADDGTITEYYRPEAIYALRPVAEDIARIEAARHGDPRPVRHLDYRQLPSPGNSLSAVCRRVLRDAAVDGDEIPF